MQYCKHDKVTKFHQGRNFFITNVLIFIVCNYVNIIRALMFLNKLIKTFANLSHIVCVLLTKLSMSDWIILLYIYY